MIPRQKLEEFKSIIEEKNKKLDSLKDIDVKFNRYTYQCENLILEERYENLCENKWQMYFLNPEDKDRPNVLGIYKDEFKIPDNWRTKLNTRLDFPCAFEYNLAHENYNASLIFSDRNCFLAIEAPSSKNIKQFFELVDKYDISHFVKLNAPNEYDEDYYPFWEDRKMEKDNILKFANGNVELLSHIWKNRKETNPQIICEMVNKIRNTENGKIIAVSCRGGAGRTATFIASYILIDEIENQLSNGVKIQDIDVSIDKIVWNILVQRPYAIAFVAQYINLYRIVDCYISSLMSKK